MYRKVAKIIHEMTHRELCLLGAKYMKSKGIARFKGKPRYVVVELERVGECPDVYGFGSCNSQLLEIKVSRSDFLADKNKICRLISEKGLGELRAYLCPIDLIKVDELPYRWGLYYADEKGNIFCVKEPEIQPSCAFSELSLAVSIMRRENINPQIFNYKKYKK